MLNPEVFQQILLRIHWVEVDLLASRINHQLTTFVSWRPGRAGNGIQCIQFDLRSPEVLSFPAILPDSSLHKKASGRLSFHHTSLEEQVMVSSDYISPSRQATAVTQGQQTAAIARNKQSASSVQE